jgi:hypothetical protein
VGQSYNSLQSIIAALPYKDKTIVFYSGRTSTDQVAGFARGTKHSIGRKIMAKEIVARLKELKAYVKKKK